MPEHNQLQSIAKNPSYGLPEMKIKITQNKPKARVTRGSSSLKSSKKFPKIHQNIKNEK